WRRCPRNFLCRSRKETVLQAGGYAAVECPRRRNGGLEACRRLPQRLLNTLAVANSQPRVAVGRSRMTSNSHELALRLASFQFQHNPAWRRLCELRGWTPGEVDDWRQIPAAPAEAFKELELTTLPPEQRVTVFHSSGTAAQSPS